MPDHLIFAPPSINYPGFKDVLRRYESPLAVHDAAPRLYGACIAAGLDPAVALAFAIKEHSLRWLGVAEKTLGWGNVVCTERWTNQGGRCIGRFAAYDTYEQGLVEWLGVMQRVYRDRGLLSISQAVPIYAPTSDGNDPDAYVEQVNGWIEAWERRYGQAMLEVIPASFAVAVTGEFVNIREFPGTEYGVLTAATKAASPRLSATGYLLDGPAYSHNGGPTSTTWCRVRVPSTNKEGWVVLAAGLTESALPPTTEQLQKNLQTATNNNKKLKTSLSQAETKLAESNARYEALVARLKSTQVQRPGEVITAAQAVGL
ncbi:MAG: hypothetical protein M3P51_13360 [Chloroflexota bacterium]|nr:hypothetical protein [Chloroflexota bacterium]